MSASFMELGSTDSAEAAASKVAQHIESMTDSSDIFDCLTQSGTTPVSGLGEKFYLKGAPEFVSTRRVPIPGELQMQMNNVHKDFSMGFFTEINRVWVIIDNNLYMWNYETNDDLAFFDSSDAAIIKVALVKIKPGVFESHIQYGLVVGTISDISLYPIFEIDDHKNSAISIDTNRFFRIVQDGATVHDIMHTRNGRIFYTADDQLYEFYYEKQTGWFGSSHKCKGINQSATILGTLIPISFFGNTKETLDQVTIDKSRNILYCLGRMGSILHEAHLLTQFGHDESTFTNITSIRALEAHQSAQLNLVATTVKGVRMYMSVLARNLNSIPSNGQQVFTHTKNFLQSDVRPQCLRVAHVRFAPGITPTSIYGDGPTGVSVVYLDETICAMTTANRNVVFTFCNFFHPTAKMFVESSTECDVTGNVWEIEAVSKVKVNSRPAPRGIVERVKPHAFYRSQLQENTRLLVCSSEGVFEFTHVNALDALREALFDGGVEGKSTLQLWQKMGSTEMLVLAFRILASDLPIDERIKNKAEQILHNLKEAPEIVENDRNIADTSVWSPNESSIAEWRHRIKTPLLSSTPRGAESTQKQVYNSPFSPLLNFSITSGNANIKMSPSRRHDALFFYFSRLVTPIWNDTICEVINGKQLQITFNPEEIMVLKSEIEKLGHIMDEYRLVPSIEFAGYASNMNDKLNAEANTLERASLLGLRKLVDATVETLSLWLLAHEYNLGAISAGMSPSSLPNFASRRLSVLVADGSNLNAELIRAMIKYFLGDEAGTKQLSENLRSVCPNLYSEDDACVTFAMEQLESAKKMNVGASRRRLVQSAVEMFKQSIGKVALSSTCQTLAESVDAYEEVVELCLLRANKEDPKQLALIGYKQGRGGADVEMRLAEKKRTECYKVIIDELDKLEDVAANNCHRDYVMHRDLMISAVINSDDQLAHAEVFRWLIKRNKTNVILQSKSPYVESFLKYEISTGRGQKYLDLLWRFYEKSGNYDKAAALLSELAANDDQKMGLSQRCAYLSHAILCAQSCKDMVMTSSIDELRDRLDVANIQMRIKESLDLPSARNQEIVRQLDGPIWSLQELVMKYVVPYKLHKIKLAALHCANMYVEEHIFDTWENIIQDEFVTARDPSSLHDNLYSTIGELYSIYRETNYFPRDFIIRRILEIGSGGLTENQRMVLTSNFYPSFSKRIGLTCVEFLKVASDQLRNGGDAWWTQNEKGQEYITEVVLALSKAVFKELETASVSLRRAIASECLTHVLPFIRRANDVSAPANIQNLREELSSIQMRLSEFSS